jgi:hypothetical protein
MHFKSNPEWNISTSKAGMCAGFDIVDRILGDCYSTYDAKTLANLRVDELLKKRAMLLILFLPVATKHQIKVQIRSQHTKTANCMPNCGIAFEAGRNDFE